MMSQSPQSQHTMGTTKTEQQKGVFNPPKTNMFEAEIKDKEPS
jgi:hypothetical protein